MSEEMVNYQVSPEMAKLKPSLMAKLARIMGKIDRIPKNGWNSFHKYHYATETDVAEHCRNLMVEEKVVLIPDMQEVIQVERDKGGTKIADITRVKVVFTFYDGDSDEKIAFTVVGDAQDSVDKGIYKAFTGAQKYALMKSFLIPTGDDPELEEEKKTKKEKPKEEDVPNFPVPPEPPKEEPKKNFKFLQAMGVEKKRIGDALYYETLKVYGFSHSTDIEDRERQKAIYLALKDIQVM